MLNLPLFCVRLFRGMRRHGSQRCVSLMLVFGALMLAPLLLDWHAAPPLPPVEAHVAKVDPKIVEQVHGSLQTSSTPTAIADAAPSLFRLPTLTPAIRGRSRHVEFYSPALARTMDYWLYLPPNYAASTRRYPVLYVLHGRGGSSREWKEYGLFDQADTLIRENRIAPLIIVSPQGDLGYWMNHVHGGPRWGDYITDDLIPHVDATYRTQADQRHRAIGGISMGGHGALQLALNHPRLFDVVGGHSAVFRSEVEAFAFFGTGAEYQQRDPISLVTELNLPVSFALWLDMGVDDQWLPRTRYFHEILVQRGVPHTWHLDPGGHEGAYWRRHLRAYLEWYDKALR